MTHASLAPAALALLMVTACSGPGEVRDAFGRDGQVIALSGGSAGAANACIACHGLKGEGDGHRSPRLAGLDRGYLLRQIGFYADGQRIHPQMVAIAKALPPAERQLVADYYARLPGAGSAACVAAPASAEALYRQGDPARNIPACTSCHGQDGAGNAGNPPLAGQPAPYLDQQLAEWRKGDRYGDPMGSMTRIAKALTAGESAALSAYAQRLPGGPGYRGSTAKCPPAHRGPTNGA